MVLQRRLSPDEEQVVQELIPTLPRIPDSGFRWVLEAGAVETITQALARPLRTAFNPSPGPTRLVPEDRAEALGREFVQLFSEAATFMTNINHPEYWYWTRVSPDTLDAIVIGDEKNVGFCWIAEDADDPFPRL